MDAERLSQRVLGLTLGVLLLTGCGGTPLEPEAMATPVPRVTTPVPPATTPALPTATTVPMTAAEAQGDVAPTATPAAPTSSPTPLPPTDTSVLPTPTHTPIPPTDTSATVRVPDIKVVVDNRDPAFSTEGSWFVGDGGQSYSGDCHWAPRGIQNIAYVRPKLPEAGAYEVFAWWCGDPNHDQSRRARIEIHPYQGVPVPYEVDVNLQEDAGQWNSLGTYDLGPGSFLSVDGNLNGNIVADAFRFVYRSPEQAVITPTPLPTQDPTTHHPPSPLEQLTSGDLSQRLGLVQRFYPYTPITSMEQTVFDDCQAFPRDGCGGSRDGWLVQVQYQEMVVPYRVSLDYHFVAIEPPDSLTGRQLLYLFGTEGGRFFRVDRYPDDTWHLSGADFELTRASHLPLDAELVNRLRSFVQAYGSVTLETPDGIGLRLYGLGERVQLSEGDRGLLATLGAELATSLGW